MSSNHYPSLSSEDSTGYIIMNSDRRGKRFVAIPTDNDGKIVHFGSSEHENYTMHKDPKRKQSYLNRHAKNERWDDLTTAGAWSRHLLWNKETLQDSSRDMENHFGIKITLAI